MATLEFIVPTQWDGKKLDTFLRTVHHFSGTTIKRAKSIRGGLTMDGQHIRTVDSLRAGAVIRVVTDMVHRSYLPSTTIVEALYTDDDLIIYNKPSGMPCHPSKGHPFDTLANVFAAQPDTSGLYFRAIGRLDRDTSGVVLCAKHAHAAYRLSGVNKPFKIYLALVANPLLQSSGTVDVPIARAAQGGQRRCVRADGQHAVTQYKTLLTGVRISFLALWLETGRTHQIRVHMAHLGNPLMGDGLYGGDCTVLQRHALHCFTMVLTHPISGVEVKATAGLPVDMKTELQKYFSEKQIRKALIEAQRL
ncbi:MAG: RluA family pseudouridine synthase [Candidatus Fimivivens sp.]